MWPGGCSSSGWRRRCPWTRSAWRSSTTTGRLWSAREGRETDKSVSLFPNSHPNVVSPESPEKFTVNRKLIEQGSVFISWLQLCRSLHIPPWAVVFDSSSHYHGINQIKLGSLTPKLICQNLQLLRKENRFESKTMAAEHVTAGLQSLLLVLMDHDRNQQSWASNFAGGPTFWSTSCGPWVVWQWKL